MSCISETCRYAQCVKKWMRSAMYLSSYHDICDIYHQNSMTEINLFDIYSWHKQSVYDTCQEIILPTTWKKSPSGWMTPEIILLNDLKTPQKWSLAFPRPLSAADWWQILHRSSLDVVRCCWWLRRYRSRSWTSTLELFQARARLELREECSEQDAREVIEIMKYRFVRLA